MTFRTPPGDERERSCCTADDNSTGGDNSCGFISYQNPKVVVGAICIYQNQVLLCKRGIEPCMGKWGYPQGFLELGESTREGARRETLEESGAVVENDTDMPLLAVYNLAGAQVQLVYTATLLTDQVQAGIESEDVAFFAWDDIPWNELAFPTVTWALEYARDHYNTALRRLPLPLPTSDDNAAALPKENDGGGGLVSVVVPQQRSKVYVDGKWSFVEDV